MKNLLFYLLIFMVSDSIGQIGFDEHIVVDRSLFRSVFAADIDGDGANDLIAAEENHDKISWYRNTDSLGLFGSAQIISKEADGAKSVFAADIDGDGDVDVLSASYHDAKIAWYENTDSLGGVWEEHVISTEETEAVSVTVGDMDGDGDLDIVSGAMHKVVWFENVDGHGDFSIRHNVSLESESYHYVVKVADIDNDGDMDIVARAKDFLMWFENLDANEGTFGERILIQYISNLRSIDVADIDGDGYKDILGASSPGSLNKEIFWYPNNDGSFGDRIAIASFTPQQAGKPSAVYAADIDGDDDLDLLVGTEGFISWYRNTDGLGHFETGLDVYHGGGLAFFAKDLNGDGRDDAIALSYHSDRILWFSDTTGNGDLSMQQAISTNVIGIRCVTSADMDNDGDLDILFSSSVNDKVGWCENVNGLGNFERQRVISDTEWNAGDVFPADIDGDGDQDVVTTSKSNKNVSWYENIDGQGNFYINQVVGSQFVGVKLVSVEDIDGDGDMDIIAAGHKTVSFYENTDGHGLFEAKQFCLLPSFYDVVSVFIVDVDGDGDKDILLETLAGIVWFENTDGLGTFSVYQVVVSNVRGLAIADVDADGDIDIVTGSSNNLVWYENTDGLGNFETIHNESSMNVGYVFTDDVDGDGDIDIIASHRWLETIVWFENIDGLGTFGVEQILTDNDRTLSTCSGDFDGDGDNDFVVAADGQNKILWFENVDVVSNEIIGRVHLDMDDNGCDSSDLSVSGVLVATDDGTATMASLTASYGIYQLFPKEGDFTTSIVSDLPDFLTINPESTQTVFDTIGNIQMIDFCLEPNQAVNDLSICLVPVRATWAGFNSICQIVITNNGTTQLSGDVVLSYDSFKMNFLSASEPVSGQTDNSIVFSYIDLNPFETSTIDVSFHLFSPPTVNLGDTLTFTATVTPVSDDLNPEDNACTMPIVVVGSLDPNDITVLEGEELPIENADKYLHYVIRFQNTGTAYATKVRVENILDPNLDWTSLKLESASHECKVEVVNGDTVNFVFNGIYLQDSTHNEPKSHGFIAYKIKPKADITVGTVISNQVDIFFDFNLPVTTNMVTTEFVEVLAVGVIYQSDFMIYPVPTSGLAYIKSKNPIAKVFVYNSYGQLVLSMEHTALLDISHLPVGVYFCKIIDTNSISQTVELVKK